MKFYTSVHQVKNNLLVSGYENGKRVRKRVPYKPYLFVPSRKESEYHTLEGQAVERMDFDSIRDAKDFLQEYKDVSGFPIYGLNNFQYVYIFDEYKKSGEIEYDVSSINVGIIDIEVDISDNQGFPDIQEANNEITLITLELNDHYHVYGCGEYVNEDDDVTYYQCHNEKDLLRRFVQKWVDLDLDAISGWNNEMFDLPYTINRIVKILGKEWAQKLSPWGILEERSVEIFGRPQQVYIPLGISNLDYQQLYKKFGYTQQEQYTLEHIAQTELGEGKTEFEGTLADLQKNWQLYTEYNIRDVRLVKKLDQKKKLLELVFAIAYDAGVLYHDTFTTVNLWDVLIHNYLMEHKTVIPQFKRQIADKSIAGGYVKESLIGMYDWVVSFDLTSLYPMIIQQYNISPETYIGEFPYLMSMEDLLAGKMAKHKGFLVENNCTVTGNMQMFSKEKQGFLPAIMAKLFGDRKVFKTKMLKERDEAEAVKAELARRGIKV